MRFGIYGAVACMGISGANIPARCVLAGETVPVETETKTDDNFFQVVLPSNTEHVFDFIMDPQKLISQTNAAAYGGSTFEDNSTLFFRRTDGGASEDYSSSSDALVITNTGTVDVDLVLTASVSLDDTEGMTMTDDCNFTDDTDASLYLALTDGKNTVAIDREKGASVSAMLSGISEEGGTGSEYRFWLTGAVNEKGDWSEVTGAVPEVTVTWCVSPRRAAVPEDTVMEEKNSPKSTELPAGNNNETEEDRPETTGEPETETLPEEDGNQERTSEPEAVIPSEGTVQEQEKPGTEKLPEENAGQEQAKEPEEQ